ncbi:sigma factor regulatory protein, FecR/PupR family [Bacteriovorax sp. BSW11_IV]|uniref:FecR domain-containing protein n=1 Tax=Bacteriovorax sp. BSW11_IV TaxID=1353529 RepID=UPI00038A30BF|nr:FecR domain-containing protein [Bacteriovorax sp. BSW11_IV]EQC48465.1 sigma factor regulatory protein, FecR/PupR family [Bacteriovorax sp. BSW11_IV]
MITVNFRILLLLSFFISINSNASISASVTKVRGSVTKLLPHSIVASDVKSGDKLPEDTSIVTGDRSFVKIIFNDNSQVSLGPNSKLVITELKKSEAGVISLLKGRLRSQVERKDNDKNKLFIQTRTAALGVRGTDFQTIYNPENNVTNLLTFKGKVAMVKIDDKLQKELLSEQKDVKYLEERDAKGQLKIHREKTHVKASSEQLDKILEDKKVVEVEKGQFSGVSDSLERATEPVRISPVQFSALYQNAGLMDKGEQKIAAIKSTDATVALIDQAPQKAPAEGFYDEKTGKLAPKAGGLIDLETGVYVPPTKEAAFDPKNKVYIADNLGSIDKNSGDFIAPAGLKLDAVKGFVPEKSGLKNQETLVALSGDLNEQTNLKIWRPTEDRKELVVAKDNYLSSREEFSKGQLLVSYLTGGQKLKGTKSNKFNDTEKDTQSYSGFNIQYAHSSDGNWQLINELGYRSLDFGIVGNGFAQNSKGLFTIGIGLRKYFNEKWNFVSRLSLEQEFFYNVKTENSVDTFSLKKITLFKWRNYFEGHLVRWQRFSITGMGGLLLIPTKETGDVETSMAFGLNLGVGLKYWPSPKHFLKLDMTTENFSGDVKSESFSSNQEHSSGVLALRYGRLF